MSDVDQRAIRRRRTDGATSRRRSIELTTSINKMTSLFMCSTEAAAGHFAMSTPDVSTETLRSEAKFTWHL